MGNRVKKRKKEWKAYTFKMSTMILYGHILIKEEKYVELVMHYCIICISVWPIVLIFTSQDGAF